jgi:single-strand DNA-binding protein
MLNNTNLVGRLTQDPTLNSLPSGDQVCNLRIAVDGMAAGREVGYIDVAAFGKPGEAAARVLTKGWLVAVSGRLEHRTWKTDGGERRQSYRVVGNVDFLSAPKGDAPGEDASEPEEVATAA